MNEKIDVLLVSAPSPNPSTEEAFQTQGMPQLGLGYIATYLNKFNYTALIFDMNFNFNTIHTLLNHVDERQPKIIGISCTTETYNNAVRITRILKKHNNELCVIVGGPHVSFEYKAALEECDKIDFVSINEGEISFKKICDYHIKKVIGIDDLTGVAYKKDGKIYRAKSEPFISCLDELPIPDRSLFLDYDKYPTPATISTSRGCPGKCIFCAASTLSGGRYRMRSAKNVVDEFEYLKSLGYDHVTVVDDTMTVSPKRLYEFTDELISRNLSMSWYCEFHSNSTPIPPRNTSTVVFVIRISAFCPINSYGTNSSIHRNVVIRCDCRDLPFGKLKRSLRSGKRTDFSFSNY